MKKKIFTFIITGFLTLAFLGCGENDKKEVRFADAGWDSNKVHNAVAGFIIENAFGYTWSEVPGSTPILHEAIKSGEIDVHMEEWTDNIPSYYPDLKSGLFQELGTNFDDNRQGIYVPKYVIETMAPDLKSVKDLPKYKELFKDSENPEKGRIYGAIPGWEIDNIMYKKYEAYGLDKDFVYFRPGSDAALSAAFTAAYEKKEPIVGYYWEPTWLLGKYDFVLLEDEPYDAEKYFEGKTACPSVKVTIGASNKFKEKAPEIAAFLSKYHTSSKLTSEALAHMQETGDNYNATAKWLLKNNDNLIDQWLDADKAAAVRKALN
ncbi:ABC transporter substrate-binding protein [Fusobacterium varium]|uniref:ABC transporter substrate-binding protein n=1 Tax=Fusobacterium varium TaxID=856 RepID=UPI0035691895